jgi:hypothetical protein
MAFSQVRQGKKGERSIFKPGHQLCDSDYAAPKYVYVNRDGGLPSAFNGSESWTEFKFPKDFGVVAGLVVAFDINNTTAFPATVLPTPLWISRLEIYLGQDLIETVYADDQLHETVGFRTYQNYDQINETINMSENYDLVPETVPANAQSQRWYLPLDGTLISSVRPYVAGYNATWRIRLYFATSIHIGSYGVSAPISLGEVQLVMEQADLSPAEKQKVASAHKYGVVDSQFYSRQRQQEVLPMTASNSAGTPLYLRSFKNQSAGLLVYTTVQSAQNADRLRLLPLSTIQLQDAMGNKITEILRGDFLKPYTWGDHVDSPYTTYSQNGFTSDGVSEPNPCQPRGANLYLLPFSSSFQDSVVRGCDFGTFQMTTQEKLMIVPDGSQMAGASGTDGGIPPSWGYFQTTPPVYASNLSISTAGVTGVGWQDTMTTVISYDLGHLVVSNGDHYVSYGSN